MAQIDSNDLSIKLEQDNNKEEEKIEKYGKKKVIKKIKITKIIIPLLLLLFFILGIYSFLDKYTIISKFKLKNLEENPKSKFKENIEKANYNFEKKLLIDFIAELRILIEKYYKINDSNNIIKHISASEN